MTVTVTDSPPLLHISLPLTTLAVPFLPSLTITKSTAPHYGILHSPASTSTLSSSSAPAPQHLLEFPPRSTAPSSASAQAAHIYNVQSSSSTAIDGASSTSATAAGGAPPEGYSDVLLAWSEPRQAYVLEPVRSTLLLRHERARRAAGSRAKELLSRLPSSTRDDEPIEAEEQAAKGAKRRRLSRPSVKEEAIKDTATPPRRSLGASLPSKDVAEGMPSLPLPGAAGGDRDRTKAKTPTMQSTERRAVSPAQQVNLPASSTRDGEPRTLASPVGLGLRTTNVDDEDGDEDDDDAAARALELEFEAAMDTGDSNMVAKAEAEAAAATSPSPSASTSTSPARVHSPAKLHLQQPLATPLTLTLTKASSATSTATGTATGPAAATSPPPAPLSSAAALAGATQGGSASANRWKATASRQPMAYSGSNAGTGQPSQYDDDDDDEEEDEEDEDEEEEEDSEEAEGGSEDLDEFARLLEEELAGAGD